MKTYDTILLLIQMCIFEGLFAGKRFRLLSTWIWAPIPESPPTTNPSRGSMDPQPTLELPFSALKLFSTRRSTSTVPFCLLRLFFPLLPTQLPQLNQTSSTRSLPPALEQPSAAANCHPTNST
jgi:hypothetical protein